MRNHIISSRSHSTSSIATQQLFRNTYFLLSLTLLFSALTATLAMLYHAAPPNAFVMLIGMFGLSMLTTTLRNSAWGLASIFAFTGFMGYVLGPTLNLILHNFSNGSAIISTALGSTGIIFMTLSAYTLMTKKDFSYMGGLLFVGILVAFMASIGGLFFNIPLLHILVSCVFALLSSALILYHTSSIIHGGETNYIMATISLYVALFNLFVSLLHILSFFAGNRD